MKASADDGGVGLTPHAFTASVGLRALDLLKEMAGALSLFAALAMMPMMAVAATDSGVVISNTAQLEFARSGLSTTETVNSNTVSATVVPVPSASSLSVFRFTDATSATQTTTAGPSQCLQNGSFNNLPQPTFANGSSVDASQLLALIRTDIVHANDAVFLQVSDADQNRDAGVIDTTDLIVTSAIGDTETIRLRETGINTGVFVGYIQTRSSATANNGDCSLQVDRDSLITAAYTDSYNNTDTSNVSVLVDPYGLIFDSLTGQPVNGARVRLINVATGLPAAVFGDNGSSTYPAEMTTGSAVTDGGGTVYNLPAGVFRFPLVALGQYRLEITPPTGYTFASGRSIAELNQLPGAPYRLSTASFGAPFSVTTPAAVAIDLPLDSSGTQLFLTKSTTTTTAAQGDFVQYQLSIQNASNSIQVSNVEVTDVLPHGLRYQSGSARLDGAVVADPAISSDGRTLRFAIGTLAAAANLKLSYVVEVTVAARDDKLVNRAQAANTAGASSNTAQATIRLRNELFTETSFIMGRVVTGTCEQNSETLNGVPGVRIYLEDGRYAVTDEEGKYHFEGVPAGSHVVQLDTVTVPDTLEPQLCDDRVRHAGSSYSQFVDIRAGALWRADFVLKEKAPPVGQVNYGMTTRIAGDTELLHTLNTEVSALPISNIKLMVTLPDGIEYVAGSAEVTGQVIADPQNMNGTLIFRVDELAAGAQHSLSFKTRVKDAAAGGFIIKSVLLFDTPLEKNQRSSSVENRATRGEMNYESASYRFSPHFSVLGTELSADDRAQLDKLATEWRGVQNLRIKAVGHTDKNVIPPSKQHLFEDNYVLSLARANSVAEYLRDALALMPEQIETDGKGPDEPIAVGDDAASLAKNRRVEISIDGVRIKQLGLVSVIKSRDEAPLLNTTGAVISKQSLNAAKLADVSSIVRKLTADVDVETLSVGMNGGIALVRPAANEVPPIPSIKIAVQHLPTQKVELLLNGAPVSGLNFDGQSTKSDNSLSLSRWRGVDLKNGNNQLIVIVRDANDVEVERIIRTVHYSGGAVRGELVKEQSNLSADGSSRPVIALRMFDAAGQPARPGTMGSYSVEAPYRSWWEVQQLQDKQLASLAPRDAQFVVDDDGLARIELEPTTSSGMAVVQLQFNERQVQDLRVWLEPQARDWVLVGLAEGTVGYNTISNNAEAASADDIEDGYEQDGRVAFFAKGRIKGDFLLTLAYDTARDTNKDKQSLLGVIDPEKYYSLYGDASQQLFEAASSRKLYIKLERRQFMAMFGDFNTGMTVTELGRYSRTLNGLKSEFAGERFGYTAFAANTDQGYVQDELQGDGTSGLYRLTQSDIIAGSDKLRIEVRDRFNTGTVVSTTTLSRYIDYDIDYSNGTLYFKQPVMSRDANFNPQFIIVDYEVDSAMNEAVSAGGRAYAKLGKSRKTEVGISFINEGAQVGDTRVASLDTRIQLAEGTQFRAEVARSDSDNPARAATADAYFTELKHVSNHIDANAYFRVEEDNFGFGQQLSTENGSRKAGVDARLKFNDKWSVRAEGQHQERLSSDATRELASVQVQRDTQITNVGVGVRHVADSNTSIGNSNSEQGFVSGSVKLLDQRLTLRAEQDVALSAPSAVTDYPDRSLIGADYKLTRETSVFTDYEHANGATIDADMTRIGLRASPWERAQLSSSMTQQFTENGARTFANLGLTQGWQVNERWAMDFGVDQSKTLRGNDSYDFNTNTTPASGTYSQGTVTNFQTGDFLALSLASLYRSELWSVTERVEYRNGSNEDRWSLVSGFYREAVRGHAFAFITQYLNNHSNTTGDSLTANLQLSWAYRPVDSRWIVLDKFDLKHQSTDSTSQKVTSSRLVNNTHTNWQLNTRTQLGLQFGARYVLTSFDGDEYRGTSALLGADYRHDLNKTFDVGMHGSVMQSFKSGVSTASLGADVGVSFMKNAWVSLGYNFQGYNDKDFDDAHYLSQGPYLKFRIKFDQDTFKDLNLSSMRAKK
ncbi:MAG: OmpA family protein [Steroidobacteraceae bacterium]